MYFQDFVFSVELLSQVCLKIIQKMNKAMFFLDIAETHCNAKWYHLKRKKRTKEFTPC